MTKSALVLVHHGSEEMEAVITIDVLRRGGVKVVVASITEDLTIECSRGVKLVADVALPTLSQNETLKHDAIVLPGGLGGAKAFRDKENVQNLIKAYKEDNRIVAAICAAPIAFIPEKLYTDSRFTSHPSVKAELEEAGFKHYVEERVVVDGNLITSRGPGTALEFGVKLVEVLAGKDKANSIKGPMVTSF